MKPNSIYKSGFKAFTMIPTVEEPLTIDKYEGYIDFLQHLKGFEALVVYKLHDISGPRKDWLYDWIIEAFYSSVDTTEESVLRELINCPMVGNQWEISIHKDYVKMTS